jgi:hypothetical protein
LNSHSNSPTKTAFAHTTFAGNNKVKKPKTRVLSVKIPIEDYQAYKVFANEMFYGSMSETVKTALTRLLCANAVDDEKFEILKDAARTGNFSRIDDAFFIRKPSLVRQKPRNWRIDFV